MTNLELGHFEILHNKFGLCANIFFVIVDYFTRSVMFRSFQSTLSFIKQASKRRFDGMLTTMGSVDHSKVNFAHLINST